MRALVVAAGVLLAAGAQAQEMPRFEISIRDHRFAPAEVHIPADTRVVLQVRNEDATAEEFESGPLGVEKVIPGGRQLPVRIGPLPPGRYPFIGEYHSDTASGVVVVDPAR